MDIEPHLLNDTKLKRLNKLFFKNYALPFQYLDLEGNPARPAAHDPKRQPLCALLAQNPASCAACQIEHQRAIELAFSFGESYSFVCHAGLLANCTPLLHGSLRLGALLSGMTLPENFSTTMSQEIGQRLTRFEFPEAKVHAAVEGHLYVPGKTLQEAGTFLLQRAEDFLRLDMAGLREQHEQTRQQAQIAETLQAIKQRVPGGSVPYPYECEKALIEKVKLGDRYGTAAILNKILGTIMFRDPVGSSLFKIRLIELLAVLSRAAAEAGADMDRVLARNLVNIRQILNTEDHTDLCITITKALNDFLGIVCARRETQTPTPLNAIVVYMERHFDQNLNVEELARQAHLSPSHVSHLFKKKFGLSMIEMLTGIRIENAKKLLLETNLSCMEIALRIGYYDQAYFTRIFTRREKVTPRRFRVLNRS